MSKKANNALGKVCIGEKYVDTVIHSLAAHPYLWAFALCILINPLYFGCYACVPDNSLMIVSLSVIAAGIFAIYRFYKAAVLDRAEAYISVGALIAVTCIFAYIFSMDYWVGSLLIFIFGVGILLLLYRLSDKKKSLEKMRSLLIIAIGFLVRLCYVYMTENSNGNRQNDVGKFGYEEGHAAYIEYIINNHHLPDFDVREVWQFAHPPLHHIICAAWIEISEKIFGVGYEAACESIQTLTLFYSMTIIISAYKIFRYFKLKGCAFYVPLLITVFHPALIRMAAAVNNDVLSVAFIMGAIVCTIRWYENQTLTGILKIALCVGLGMMTKLMAAVVAPPIAVVFLVVLIKKFKTVGKRLIGQFSLFGIVCVPLGLWFEIRNYINYGIPFTYVHKPSETEWGEFQYIGDRSFISRITDFSLYQFSDVLVQKSSLGCEYDDFNPITVILKSAAVGELLSGCRISSGFLLSIMPLLFWVSVLLAIVAFISMAVMLFKKCGMNRLWKAFWAVFYFFTMFVFYKSCYDYPYVCTMNYRYITPTLVVTVLFLGFFMQSVSERGKGGVIVNKAISLLTTVFCVLSVIFFIVTEKLWI